MPRKRERIRYFDGFEWRNHNPDIDLVVSRYTMSGPFGMTKQFFFPEIPSGEIWVDERFKNERKLLCKVHHLEKHFSHWPDAKLRKYLKRKLTKKGPVPEFMVEKETIALGNIDVEIWYVRGDIVRHHFDPCFILGGHDLVYDYIREYGKNLIWIDILQNPHEIIYTRFHEIREWKKMKWGCMRYARAHNIAIKEEYEIREPERSMATKPLRMKPHMQSPGFCGPASLKIALTKFGKTCDEGQLAKLCGATEEEGTDHESLVAGAVKLGATVFEKSNGSIEELKFFVHKKRLPVIVGWWADDGSNPNRESENPEDDQGHFSVIYAITKTHIYLLDPSSDTGITRLSIKKFLSCWFDTDTPQYVRVNRWYMVINFEGAKFDIPGGVNH